MWDSLDHLQPLKICGCEGETIGYQSELVGVENREQISWAKIFIWRAIMKPVDPKFPGTGFGAKI
jgi:hypothetical protein